MQRSSPIILILLFALTACSQNSNSGLIFDHTQLPTSSNLVNSTGFSINNDDVDLDEYGGAISLGIGLSTTGIGIPLRLYLKPSMAIEFGLYYNPYFLFTINSNSNQIEKVDVYHHAVLAGGFIYYPRMEHKLIKVRKNGLSVKTGHSFGVVPETILSIGWATEKIRDKQKDRSFSAELGLGITYLHENDFSDVYGLTNTNISPFLYWKIQWAWFLKGYKQTTPEEMKNVFE